MIARVLAQDKTRDTAEINIYRLKNVAGYTFSYMMGLFAIVCTWFTLKAKKTLHKILGAVSILICFYYIVQTMYTTLLILSSISVIALVLIKGKHLLTKILIVILGSVILFNLELFLKFLSEVFSFSQVLSIKFQQMYIAFKYDDIESVGVRPQLLKIAIQNWIKSPIFGIKNTNPAHSVLFGILQNNGLIGLVSWATIFGMSWKRIYTYLKIRNFDTTMFTIGMCYVSLLSVLNDIRGAYEITIIAFFGIPLFITVFSELINGETVTYKKKTRKKSDIING